MVKTVGAIVVIGIIVVATFLYGNQQRQLQVRRDQDVRRQQEQKAAENKPAVTSVDPATKSVAPTPVPGVGGGMIPSTTPATGGELGYLLPATLILGLVQAYRQSRTSLRRAFSVR